MRYCYIVAVLFIFSILVNSCNGGINVVIGNKVNDNIKQISPEKWQQLAKKKIFWGHQSVGSNILKGMQELLTEHPEIPLKIAAVKDPYVLGTGVLSHDNVGMNGDPSSKIKDFVRMMDNGIGVQADYAFFKFCFIDFNGNSNVKKLFKEYKIAMRKIKEKYPQVKIMHATIPLVKVQSGPKAWLKKIIGRTLDGTIDNVKRHAFNEMIKAEYGGKDPIFDIAKYESTRPDGSREIHKLNGKEYFSLVPAYTSDGGHLNDLGSRFLAAKLFVLLAGSINVK